MSPVRKPRPATDRGGRARAAREIHVEVELVDADDRTGIAELMLELLDTPVTPGKRR